MPTPVDGDRVNTELSVIVFGLEKQNRHYRCCRTTPWMSRRAFAMDKQVAEFLHAAALRSLSRPPVVNISSSP